MAVPDRAHGTVTKHQTLKILPQTGPGEQGQWTTIPTTLTRVEGLAPVWAPCQSHMDQRVSRNFPQLSRRHPRAKSESPHSPCFLVFED